MSHATEKINYYKRCLSPLFFFLAVFAVLRHAALALIRRLPSRWLSNSEYLRLAYQLGKEAQLGVKTSSSQSTMARLPRVRLKLAGLDYIIKTDNPWTENFLDDEVTMSLHRWGWLLSSITESDMEYTITRDEGLSLIRSWLHNNLYDEVLCNDAYSAAERIVNGCIFLKSTGDHSIPGDVSSAFCQMAMHILSNLEYYGSGQTNNHIVNNARGLYFAINYCAFAGANNIVSDIFTDYVPKLVTSEGFLREGSSHYHFLFTRWILEVFDLSLQSTNKDLSNFLRPYLRRLIKKCWFFLVPDLSTEEWSIPLIGDVSPDFPPNWLLAIPWSAVALDIYHPGVLPKFKGELGWSMLYGFTNGTSAATELLSETYSISGWHRLANGKSTLYAYTGTDNKIGHAHADLTGFVLFYDGKHILVDSGRLNYTNQPVSEYGRSAIAHNVILVDGIGARCAVGSWVANAYRNLQIETKYSSIGGQEVLSIKHTGFARLFRGSNIGHERQFVLDRNMLRVVDNLNGHGIRNISLYFHIAPGFEDKGQGKFTRESSKLNANVNIEIESKSAKRAYCKFTIYDDLFVAAYGIRQDSKSVKFESRIGFPAKIHSQINW